MIKMPDYYLRLTFGAANDRQAQRLGMAWADTCAAEYGTRDPVVTPAGSGRPSADYGSVWPELRGYVQQAASDGDMINPQDLLLYMDELRHKALAPAREWLNEHMRGGDRG
jgi:hypothetical protein